MNQLKSKVLISALILAVFLAFLPQVTQADQYDDQINALKKKVQETQAAADAKNAEADTLKGKISGIDSQIAAAQQALNLTNAQVAQTQTQITKANQDLDRQQTILKDNLKMIYREGKVSPLEVIASSKNLSDFVAKQQYLSAIKKKVDDNLRKIEQLKKELATKKDQLAAQSNQQKEIVNQIATQRAEQASLLARTQGEESNYRKIAAEDSSRIGELRRAQAAAVAAVSSNVKYGGTGGYPWANAPFPNSIPDSWGMYQRQCVSYAAWKVATVHGNMPYWGGRGNANQWPSNARAAGIAVDGNPRVGDIAILMAGPYGHAAYVEAVLGGGKVRVSQYNANWDGAYSVADIGTAGVQFIHF